ncbi:MAG: exodeoxyribonuclease VII small subunit [Bryobacterales bacterium]|nr:exodeoxyribonuclease VII small subunit [Bryobacterales bacterium]
MSSRSGKSVLKNEDTSIATAQPGAAAEAGQLTPQSFEKGLSELEAIVAELERGELTLEDSILLFEKGMALSNACREQLAEAETRVELLLRKGGRMVAEPFPTGGRSAIASPPDPQPATGGKSESDDVIPF